MITVDMTKAKVIAHDARRAARNAAFAPLDIKATIPAESEAAEAASKASSDLQNTQSEANLNDEFLASIEAEVDSLAKEVLDNE